jgi:hypothetical protein
MVVAELEIETEGVIKEVTVIVMLFDNALVGEAQLSDEVIRQETTSPFTKVPLVKVGLFDPVGLPLSLH